MSNEVNKKWARREFERIRHQVENKQELNLYDFLRIRNFKLQNVTREKPTQIKKTTKKAFNLAKGGNIKEAIKELMVLNGVGIPIASTILAVKFPEDYCIIDRKVIKELRKEEKIDSKKEKSWTNKSGKNRVVKNNPEVYEEYLRLMRKTKLKNMSLREYEFGLWKK